MGLENGSSPDTPKVAKAPLAMAVATVLGGAEVSAQSSDTGHDLNTLMEQVEGDKSLPKRARIVPVNRKPKGEEQVDQGEQNNLRVDIQQAKDKAKAFLKSPKGQKELEKYIKDESEKEATVLSKKQFREQDIYGAKIPGLVYGVLVSELRKAGIDLKKYKIEELDNIYATSVTIEDYAKLLQVVKAPDYTKTYTYREENARMGRVMQERVGSVLEGTLKGEDFAKTFFALPKEDKERIYKFFEDYKVWEIKREKTFTKEEFTDLVKGRFIRLLHTIEQSPDRAAIASFLVKSQMNKLHKLGATELSKKINVVSGEPNKLADFAFEVFKALDDMYQQDPKTASKACKILLLLEDSLKNQK